jgi:hypothetical protein
MGFYLQGAGRVTLLRDRGSEEEAMICGSRARGTGRSYLSETKAMIYGYPREGPEPSERRGKLVGAGGGVAVAWAAAAKAKMATETTANQIPPSKSRNVIMLAIQQLGYLCVSVW